MRNESDFGQDQIVARVRVVRITPQEIREIMERSKGQVWAWFTQKKAPYRFRIKNKE